jgi:hypothetical protein
MVVVIAYNSLIWLDRYRQETLADRGLENSRVSCDNHKTLLDVVQITQQT